MKTTREQSLKIYNIVKWINPYDISNLDKEEIMQNTMKNDFEKNINELDLYIINHYEAKIELLHDTTLLKKYLNLIKDMGVK